MISLRYMINNSNKLNRKSKMPKQYSANNKPTMPKMESYNALKNQLQLETENLLRERTLLNQKYLPDPFPSQNTIIQQSGLEEEDHQPSYVNTSTPAREQESHKKRLIKTKIQEIIKICKDKDLKEAFPNEFGEVLEAEKQILNFLGEPNPQSFSNSKPRHQGSMQEGTESNPHTFQGKSQKSSIRDHLTQKFNNVLGDDAMEMIEEIERKALIQIQNLRKDKITLMKKLNLEIKQHNEERKRSFALEAEVKYLREELQRLGIQTQKKHHKHHTQHQTHQNHQEPQVQRRASEHYQPPTSMNPINEQQELQSQITRLEEQNNHFKSMIHNGQGGSLNQKLRNQLSMLENKVKSYEAVLKSQDPNGNYEFKNLWAEGSQLQNDGKRLLRATSKPQFKYRVSSSAEQSEKVKFYNEVSTLKSRIRELETQNETLQKRNSLKQPESPQTYGFSSRQTRSPTYNFGHKPTTSHYEKVINEMKRAAKQ